MDSSEQLVFYCGAATGATAMAPAHESIPVIIRSQESELCEITPWIMEKQM